MNKNEKKSDTKGLKDKVTSEKTVVFSKELRNKFVMKRSILSAQ